MADNNYVLVARDRAGARAYIVLDTEFQKSFAMVPSLLGIDTPVAFGNGALGRFRFLKGEFGGLPQGVFGMDALSHFAIGCGYIDKLKVWPTGNLEREEVAHWLFDDLAYPGVSRREFESIPIGQSGDGLPTVSVEVGGKRCAALLRLGYGQTCLPAPKDMAMVGGPIRFELASRCLVGSLAEPWIKIDGNSLSPSPSRDPSVIGTFSLNNLGSKRILVDFPARKIYIERLPADARTSFIFTQIVRSPILITDAGLRIGGPMSAAVHTIQQGYGALGCNVVSIAGVPASEISRQARAETPAAAKWLAGFMELVQPAYRLMYLKNGEIREFDVPANPTLQTKAGG